MASIRKRTWKSGGEEKTAWVADYFDQGGNRHIKTFSTKKAADAWLVTTRDQVKRGVHTPESASITVAEAAQLWLDKGELEKLERSTLRQYRNHVRHHINPLIGGEKLARLSSPAIESYRDELLAKCSRAMARKVLASVKSILGEAQRRGLVAQNAAAPVSVGTKKRENSKLTVGRDVPSKEEVQAILSAAGHWRPILATAIFAGLRSSELRGLSWDDVSFERRVIHVCQRADAWGVIGPPKSEAGDREIPMTPMVFNVLREWRLACPKGSLNLVFPNGNGRVENHANIANRGFYAAQIEAGIAEPATDAEGRPITKPLRKRGKPVIGEDDQPVMVSVMRAKYGLHTLRHFFASWIIEQGFSPKRCQVMLGHSSIQMTFDRYGHLFESPEKDQDKFAAGELAVIGR